MSCLKSISAVLIFVPAIAGAQVDGQRLPPPALAWNYVEVGGSVQPHRLNYGGTSETQLAWSLRLAFVSANTPWGMEGSIDFGNSRLTAVERRREFSFPLSLTYRVNTSNSSGVGADGVYLTSGINLITLDRTENDRARNFKGFIGSLGYRRSFGRIGALRSDVVYATDPGFHNEVTIAPAANRVGVRLVFSVFDPMSW